MPTGRTQARESVRRIALIAHMPASKPTAIHILANRNSIGFSLRLHYYRKGCKDGANGERVAHALLSGYRNVEYGTPQCAPPLCALIWQRHGHSNCSSGRIYESGFRGKPRSRLCPFARPARRVDARCSPGNESVGDRVPLAAGWWL